MRTLTTLAALCALSACAPGDELDASDAPVVSAEDTARCVASSPEPSPDASWAAAVNVCRDVYGDDDALCDPQTFVSEEAALCIADAAGQPVDDAETALDFHTDLAVPMWTVITFVEERAGSEVYAVTRVDAFDGSVIDVGETIEQPESTGGCKGYVDCG